MKHIKSFFTLIIVISGMSNVYSIQNGQKDLDLKFKNVVKLDILTDHGIWSNCTATVLSSHVVLTAAHCINYYLKSDSILKMKINNKRYNLKSVKSHPEFLKWSNKEQVLLREIFSLQGINPNSPKIPELWSEYGFLAYETALRDVALLATEESIPKNIPRTKISFSKEQSGDPVVLVGFGFTKFDTNSRQYIYENGNEGRFYGESTLDTEGDLYAVYRKNSSTPIVAPGDSGGPLLNEKGVQIGIASHGASLRSGSLYTPLWLVQDFIELNFSQ